jgi:hypothetical protein
MLVLERAARAASNGPAAVGFWRGSPGPEAGSLSDAELDQLGITVREQPGGTAGDFDLVFVEPDGSVLGWWERVLVPCGGPRLAGRPPTRRGRADR